jgi:hypothetical protein
MAVNISKPKLSSAPRRNQRQRGGPRRGGLTITNNMPEVINEVQKRAAQFAIAVNTIGAKWSKTWAPVAYGTLVNSQNISVGINGTKVSGRLTYDVEYAQYLETNENWKPKPPPKYGSGGVGQATAWNPNATPHFLKKGFEEPQPQAEIRAVREIFRSRR